MNIYIFAYYVLLLYSRMCMKTPNMYNGKVGWAVDVLHPSYQVSQIYSFLMYKK